MRINHNIASLNTYRQLTNNNIMGNKSLEKLSSGLRINKAADDAAGLAISEKMRGQIRGLDQASRNAQDSISLIQTAEGALSETHSILQRMRELSVQASNGTATDADRTAIQTEVGQLKNEITRISTATEFNTKKLLNGDIGEAASAQGTKLQSTGLTSFARLTGGATAAANDTANNGETIVINGVTVTVTGLSSGTGTATGTAIASLINNTSGIGVTASSTDGVVTLVGNTAGQNITVTGTATMANAGFGAVTSASAAVTGSTRLLDLADANGNSLGLAAADTITGATSVGGTTNNTSSYAITAADTLDNLINDINTDMAAVASVTVTSAGKVELTGATGLNSALSGFSISVSGKTTFNNAFSSWAETQAAKNAKTDASLSLQIGANENQTMSVGINEMSVTSLSLTGVNVSTLTGAQTATTVIDNAITTVSTERSKIGAYQNRLEHTIANLGTASENLTSAESRIRDVDMAKEMMEFTKNNILMQASQAMLAQANQQPQGVLQLLR